MERGEAYISGELARVHSDIRSKLMQACRELKMDFAGDGIESTTTVVNESASAIEVCLSEEYVFCLNERQLNQALEYIGDERPGFIVGTVRRVEQLVETPRPLINPITQADIERAIAERRRNSATATTRRPTRIIAGLMNMMVEGWRGEAETRLRDRAPDSPR
jgi:hypothetical protein